MKQILFAGIWFVATALNSAAETSDALDTKIILVGSVSDSQKLLRNIDRTDQLHFDA